MAPTSPLLQHAPPSPLPPHTDSDWHLWSLSHARPTVTYALWASRLCPPPTHTVATGYTSNLPSHCSVTPLHTKLEESALQDPSTEGEATEGQCLPPWAPPSSFGSHPPPPSTGNSDPNSPIQLPPVTSESPPSKRPSFFLSLFIIAPVTSPVIFVKTPLSFAHRRSSHIPCHL